MTTTENEETNANKMDEERRNLTKGDIDDKIGREIAELKIESTTNEVFEKSLEQFWKYDEKETPSSCNSEILSRCNSENISKLNSQTPMRFTSETELGLQHNKKRVRSKFRIPKSKSTNYDNVPSRYMDVFYKKKY